MPNTFPSNSVSDAALAASVPTVLNGTNSAATRRDNIQAFFENTAANLIKFGNRFLWASTALSSLTYIPIFTLTGPGVVDFLTVWRENVVGTNNNYGLRVVIDGLVVLEIDPAWSSTTQDTEGYSLIGDFLWDNTAFEPSHGGLVFETVNFVSSLSVEVKTAGSPNTDEIHAIYRWHQT